MNCFVFAHDDDGVTQREFDETKFIRERETARWKVFGQSSWPLVAARKRKQKRNETRAIFRRRRRRRRRRQNSRRRRVIKETKKRERLESTTKRNTFFPSNGI